MRKLKFFIILLMFVPTLLGMSGHANAAVPAISYTINGVTAIANIGDLAGASSILIANGGDTLNVSWNTANVSYCLRWGNWGAGSLIPASTGSETLTAFNPTVVTGYLYEIACYDEFNSMVAQAGVQVDVNPVLAAPTPTPTATSTSSVKYKGEGIISSLGTDYVVINGVKANYNFNTQIRLKTGSMNVGMKAKWEGFLDNVTGEKLATKLGTI